MCAYLCVRAGGMFAKALVCVCLRACRPTHVCGCVRQYERTCASEIAYVGGVFMRVRAIICICVLG